MASIEDSSIKFFSKASSSQWLYVLSQYQQVLNLRAQQTRGARKGGPQELIKLDHWYQEEVPKIIQSRKDRHLIHEELVQIVKWKLWRGKNRARLLDLVKINTELAVVQITKKAFRKLPSNISGAITALTTLKGIGPATASAILAAGAPENCPFMADECMMSTPGCEANDYTIAEYVNYANQINSCCERLKAEDPNAKWNPHKVELAQWTHYWIKDLKLDLLDKMPLPDGTVPDVKSDNGDTQESLSTNGAGDDKVIDDDSNISVPASNASEVEEKSSDSSSGEIASTKESIPEFRRPEGNGSAYNCIEDSKDGIILSSEENSRNNIISNEEYSNLSYSNLSSDDLNNSTAENTADNTLDISNSNNSNNFGSEEKASLKSEPVADSCENKRPVEEVSTTNDQEDHQEKKIRIE